MLSTLLLLLSSGLQAPSPAPIPARFEEDTVAAVVETSATHFCAANPSTRPVLLVIGLEDLGATGRVLLAPGARVTYPIPRDLTTDHWFRIEQRAGAHTLRSRALPVRTAPHQDREPTFIVRNEGGLSIWVGAESPCQIALLHVPDAPPADSPIDLPPARPDKSLPPA